MSKKNKLSTRINAREFSLNKERERLREKDKKKAKAKAKIAPKINTTISKTKKRIKLRKNAVIKGIKITDAESKKRVLALLAEEEASKMQMD